MSGTDIATWIGTALTIVSMGVTIFLASKAKSAAQHAEEMRDEIANRNAHSELSGLNGLIMAAIRAMDKYGPGAGPSSRYGCSPDGDAATVRALTSKMQRSSGLLKTNFSVDVTEVITSVNKLLVQFASAPNDTERDQHGQNIYNEIVEFGGNIQSVLDWNVYR